MNWLSVLERANQILDRLNYLENLIKLRENPNYLKMLDLIAYEQSIEEQSISDNYQYWAYVKEEEEKRNAYYEGLSKWDSNKEDIENIWIDLV